MSVLNLDTRILGIGITGSGAMSNVEAAYNYGSPIVAGVTPGKGGMRLFGRIPIYDSVEEAAAQHPGLNFLMCYVGAANIWSAFREALPGGRFQYGWYNAEGAQMIDALRIVKLAERHGTRIIQGIGMVDPRYRIGVGNLDFTSFAYVSHGVNYALISKSGGFTGNKAKEITSLTGDGCVFATSISGEKIRGSTYVPLLEAVRDDPDVDYVYIYGEIGGNLEEQACRYLIRESYEKPVVFEIGGWGTDFLPQGVSLGHADAITGGKGEGSLESKVAWAKASGSYVTFVPSPRALKGVLDQMRSDVVERAGFNRRDRIDLKAEVVREYVQREGALKPGKPRPVTRQVAQKLAKTATVVVQAEHLRRLRSDYEGASLEGHDAVIRNTDRGPDPCYFGVPVEEVIENSTMALEVLSFLYRIPLENITQEQVRAVLANWRRIRDSGVFDVPRSHVNASKRLFREGKTFNVAFSNAIDGIVLPAGMRGFARRRASREFLAGYQSPIGDVAREVKEGLVNDLITLVVCSKLIGEILWANREFAKAQTQLNSAYSSERLRSLEERHREQPSIEGMIFHDFTRRYPSFEQESAVRAFLIASISNGPGTMSYNAARCTYGGDGTKLSAIAAAIRCMGDNHGGAAEVCARQVHHYARQYYANLDEGKSFVLAYNCTDAKGKPLKIPLEHDRHWGDRFDIPENPLLDLGRGFVADFEGELPGAHNPDRLRKKGSGHPIFNYTNRDPRVVSCDGCLSEGAKRDPVYLLQQAIDWAYVWQKMEKYGEDGIARAPVQNPDGFEVNLLAGPYHLNQIDQLGGDRREGVTDIYYLAGMPLFQLPRVLGTISQIGYMKGGFESRTPRVLIRDLVARLTDEQTTAAMAHAREFVPRK